MCVDPSAPIGLLEPLVAGTDPLLIDGEPAQLARPVGTIWEGARLSRADPTVGEPIVELIGRHGLDSGASWLLAPGSYDLGDGSGPLIRLDPGGVLCWAATSGRSESIPVGHSFEANGTVWEVRQPRPVTARPQPVDGRRSFNRPPRLEVEPVADVVELPALPEEPVPRSRMGWAMLVAPLVMGAVMAIALRPLMGLIALVGPLMLVMSWAEDRLRIRKVRRTNATEWDSRLSKLEIGLKAAAESELQRRKTAHPPIVDLLEHPRLLANDLWARRPNQDSFLRVSLGLGSTRWIPPTPAGSESMPDDVAGLIAEASVLSDSPVEVSLLGGAGLGVAGDRSSALALVRAILLRLSVQQGPADLRLAVITVDPEEWKWCTWVPHFHLDPGSLRCRLGADREDIERVLRSLADEDRHCVVVVDGLEPSIGTRVASLVDTGRISAIIVQDEVNDLPGVCGAVVDVDGSRAVVRSSGEGEPIRLRLDGVAQDVAAYAARCLHGIDDLEDWTCSSRLPAVVPLSRLVPAVGSEAIVRSWSVPSTGLNVAVGMTEDGAFEIDLVADGPHALVAGTTGSGKSEFLRSLIAAMATAYGPDRVNFALIDYKGGSAFDACESLPHVVGLVTDLDTYMARRALRSITAEIRHRERVLRAAGAESIDKYPRSALEVLPRLVVVVDEFAALSADLPEFIPALIDVAQRGRSLGIHLILATQRPAGVVGDAIRANTNLRVALRTQTGAESSDVIGEPAAAQLPRHRPGRGYARLGPGELIAFQAATGSLAIDSDGSGGVSLAEVNFGWEPVEKNTDSPSVGSGANDLDALVSMVGTAAAEMGLANPRMPWADPLPSQVRLGDGPSPLRAVIGIADEPDRQQVVDLEWNLEDGGLLAFGTAGSGVSDALVAACFAQATTVDPGSLHIYGLDGGGGSLDVMTAWPHVGAVVGISDRERTLRLIRRLDDRLTERQSCPAQSPPILIAIDRVDSVLAALDGPADFAVRDALIRVVGEGPQFGIVPLLSASRPAAIPAVLAAGISHRFCFRLADPFEYSAVGISPKDVPDLVRGRGFDMSGRMIQVGVPTPEGLRRLGSIEFAGPLAPPIEVLPSRVPISGLVPESIVSGSGWSVPVGLGDSDLAPIGFQLHPGDHVLVAGPPRSGRTTTLASIGRLAAMSIPDVEVLALSGRHSALEHASGLLLETVGELVEAVRKSSGPTLVLVDDAERIADPALDGLFDDHRDDLHVIAAGRADALRSLYQHWTRQVRRCRLGISLQPEPELDGDLWQTRFPRHGPAIRQPGRGYLVSAGRVELVQVAAS